MTHENTHFPDITYVVDAESNGDSPPEIIELSIVTLDAGTLKWPPATWMIKPLRPIKSFATNIHGITDADVAQCPPLLSVQKDIHSFIQAGAIVAHNAHIDYKLLKLSLPGWKPAAVYDTLRLARFIAPELPSHSLSSLIRHFGISDDLSRRELFQAHRACYDAVAAAYLFLALIEKARQKGIGIEQVLRISKTNIDDDGPVQGLLF